MPSRKLPRLELIMAIRTIQRFTRACISSGNVLFVALLIQLPKAIFGGNNENSYAKFGLSMQRDWLYESSSIAIKYEGCVWSYVDDRENMGCMDDESEDGTTYWYMMANCKRAQVAYSVYATNSGTTSCGSKDFKESLLTKNGVAEFATTLGYYSYNSPISEDDVGDLPVCESDGNGYYLSVGCSDGHFTIDRFYDAYCLQRYDTYDYLSNFNSAMKSNNLNKCYSAYSSKNDESPYSSLSAFLIPESGGCSATESSFCTTSSFVSQAGSNSGFQRSNNYKSEMLSFTNKLKYGLGGTMLLGSVIMFFGILFTNRRKRRALMHRNFRAGGSSSRSKSKKSRTSSSSRQRKKKSSSGGSVVKGGTNGVMT